MSPDRQQRAHVAATRPAEVCAEPEPRWDEAALEASRRERLTWGELTRETGAAQAWAEAD